MPADAPAFLGVGASGFKFTFFAGSIIAVFTADYLSIFLSLSGIIKLFSPWADIDFSFWVIFKLIRIECWVFGTIGIALFGDVNGDPILCASL